MNVNYSGHTSLCTSNYSFILKDVLYVLNSKKNHVTIHLIFIELRPTSLLIKDQKTKTILHRVRGIGGLYLLSISTIKEVYSARRPNMWHSHLSHPSFNIVEQVLAIPICYVHKTLSELVCNPRQQSKSHRLPYPKFTSVFGFCLQLPHNVIQGPTLRKYYISFPNDYSKFNQVQLIKFNSGVFF